MDFLSNEQIPTLSKEVFEVLTTELLAWYEKAKPYLPVTEAEVTDYTRMSDSQENFISDAVTEIRKAKGSIPTVANADAITTRLANYNYDWALENTVQEIFNRVRNNRVTEGTIAYRGASSFYWSLDPAIIDKRQNAVEAKKRLAKYFERKAPSTSPTPKSKKGKGDSDAQTGTDKTE